MVAPKRPKLSIAPSVGVLIGDINRRPAGIAFSLTKFRHQKSTHKVCYDVVEWRSKEEEA